MKKKSNAGKSKCCKAEVGYSGGGYEGEEIVPIVVWCTQCQKDNPKIIKRVGRPSKALF